MKEPAPKASVSIYKTGSALTVRRRIYSGASKGGPGGPRENIRSFSRASRRRLLRKVAQLDRSVLPVFATLTYPLEYSPDPTEWKRHLNSVWAKRLRRQYPNAAYIWRLEFQRRGAPHFHLILYGATGSIEEFRQWLSLSWYETVQSGDEKHLRAGTNAKQTRSSAGTVGYMAKELGKTSQASLSDDYPDGVGRWWGVKFGGSLPWSPLEHKTISDADADRIIRLMRRHAKLRGREYHSLTVFANGPFWSERLEDILALGQEGAPSENPLASLVKAERRVRARRERGMRAAYQ